MAKKLLRLANIIAFILILINWAALHDIAKNAENLSLEWSFVTIANLIIAAVIIANILFFFKKNNP